MTAPVTVGAIESQFLYGLLLPPWPKWTNVHLGQYVQRQMQKLTVIILPDPPYNYGKLSLMS